MNCILYVPPLKGLSKVCLHGASARRVEPGGGYVSRAETIGGIPDELYFFPEVTGFIRLFLRIQVGANKYICDISEQDLHICKKCAKEKPAPVPIEFLNLVKILMIENSLYMPNT